MVVFQTQAGIAQSVEHFTRNEGVVSSSLISSLYMTDGSPVSLEYEDAGLFLGVYGCGRGTPEEGGSSPARCHLPLADASIRQEKHAGDGSGLGVLS